MICETWLNDSDSDCMLTGRTDFSVFRCDRHCADNARGGGVAILVSLNLCPVYVSSLRIPGFECIVIDIYSPLGKSSHLFRMFCVYRSPSSPSSSMKRFFSDNNQYKLAQYIRSCMAVRKVKLD